MDEFFIALIVADARMRWNGMVLKVNARQRTSTADERNIAVKKDQ
jgi:hypothetical protein